MRLSKGLSKIFWSNLADVQFEKWCRFYLLNRAYIFNSYRLLRILCIYIKKIGTHSVMRDFAGSVKNASRYQHRSEARNLYKNLFNRVINVVPLIHVENKRFCTTSYMNCLLGYHILLELLADQAISDTNHLVQSPRVQDLRCLFKY